jgi:hypothetical protein
MSKELKPGDKVRWNTSQGPTRGKTKRRLTSDAKVGGQQIRASDAGEAAHRADALKRP